MFSAQSVNHNVETDMDLFDDILKLRHIIVHEWRENPNVSSEYGKFSFNQKKPLFTAKTKLKHHGNHMKVVKKAKKSILSFEVDDTGSEIDPNKWKFLFENFKQAGDSKIWMHGDTGLGLCASSEPWSTRWEEKSRW
ncbi:hypothetical protein V6N13_019993 [Hibiscus sabdariffa]